MDVHEFSNLFGTNAKKKLTFKVSPDIYLNFQLCSGDKNPLHTDEAFAISKGFNGSVMYGNILNAFISYFVGQELPTKDVIIHSQDIIFKNPVYMNDILQFESEITGTYESVNAVEFKYIFLNNDNKVVAKGHLQIGILK